MSKRNEALKLAFAEADRRYFEKLLSEESEEWIPSAEFEEKMLELIKKQHNPFWKYTNTTKKRASLIVVSVAVILCLMMSVQAIREPVVRFFVEVYETYTKMFIEEPSPTAPEYIQTEYVPTYLPTGYIEGEVDKTLASLVIYYYNETNNYIAYHQLITKGTKLGFNTEGIPLYDITIQGCHGFYYTNKGRTEFIWSSNDYTFNLSVPDSMPFEEALKTAESVSQKNN